MKKVRIKEGQIFSIKLADRVYAFGQVIRKGEACYYMAAFDLTTESPAAFDLESLSSAKVLFLGSFFEGLIKNNRWTVVAEAPVRTVPYPCYRVLIAGDWIVESWDRRKKAILSKQSAEQFPFRAEHGAILLEEALQYHFGYKEIYPYLEKFMPEIDAEYVARIAAACPF